jgi:hypothetical protein
MDRSAREQCIGKRYPKFTKRHIYKHGAKYPHRHQSPIYNTSKRRTFPLHSTNTSAPVALQISADNFAKHIAIRLNVDIASIRFGFVGRVYPMYAYPEIIGAKRIQHHDERRCRAAAPTSVLLNPIARDCRSSRISLLDIRLNRRELPANVNATPGRRYRPARDGGQIAGSSVAV